MDRRALLGLAALTAATLPAPAKAGGGGGGNAPAAAYVRLPVTTASITRSSGSRGVLTIEAGIDAPANLALRTTQSVPRLRAAFAEVAQRLANETRAGSPPDVLRLSRDLQAEVDRVLRGPGAHVLLGTVMLN
ncbi:MAG TPA: Tat pathway signal protein [Brevundimonas sp.]|jgi:hypothetical protein|uniref:Tat pathway signal protein n=1 Tax=Brevundimonas sp. TaxID=1871086 RepID=UPI002E15473B|nr:Tat pathway signal protein [Brevundimonas sp.]